MNYPSIKTIQNGLHLDRQTALNQRVLDGSISYNQIPGILEWKDNFITLGFRPEARPCRLIGGWRRRIPSPDDGNRGRIYGDTCNTRFLAGRYGDVIGVH
ncbi:hypothetical protein CCP2SC5_920002 [Azospirillaceae bacterium]